jgi:hypothetical protein
MLTWKQRYFSFPELRAASTILNSDPNLAGQFFKQFLKLFSKPASKIEEICREKVIAMRRGYPILRRNGEGAGVRPGSTGQSGDAAAGIDKFGVGERASDQAA